MALRDGTPESSTRSSSVVESDGDDEPQWFKEIKQPDQGEQIRGQVICDTRTQNPSLVAF